MTDERVSQCLHNDAYVTFYCCAFVGLKPAAAVALGTRTNLAWGAASAVCLKSEGKTEQPVTSIVLANRTLVESTRIGVARGIVAKCHIVRNVLCVCCPKIFSRAAASCRLS